jgi:hypothetical protein
LTGKLTPTPVLTTILPLRYTHLMTAKFLALISVIGLANVCVVQAQSPTPNESPTASPSPAEKAASPSPAESPTASPKAKPTPKKAKAERKARRAARPVPAGRTTEEAANPPALGGGHGQVWVNTETGVYHREGSRFYGTTRKGKYMIEQDAIRAGYKPAPTGPSQKAARSPSSGGHPFAAWPKAKHAQRKGKTPTAASPTPSASPAKH